MKLRHVTAYTRAPSWAGRPRAVPTLHADPVRRLDGPLEHAPGPSPTTDGHARAPRSDAGPRSRGVLVAIGETLTKEATDLALDALSSMVADYREETGIEPR